MKYKLMKRVIEYAKNHLSYLVKWIILPAHILSRIINYQYFNSAYGCFTHFFISPLLLFSRFFIRQSLFPAKCGTVSDCLSVHAIKVRNMMIRTLLAFPGHCRHAVAFLALVFILSPAAIQAQSGNIVPGTAERDSVVMRTTFYFTPGNGEWIERPEYKKAGRLLRRALADTATAIRITGWADKTGTQAMNERLSLRRARTVRNYLVGKGVAADRIRFEGRGIDTLAESPDKARRADVCAVVVVAAGSGTAEPETGQVAPSVPTKEITSPKQQPTRTTPEKEIRQPEKQAGEEAATQPKQQQPEQTERPQQAATPPVREPSSPVAIPTDAIPKNRYLGVKTNIAAWAGTIMNIAADVQVSEHISVELPILWCPWYVSDKHAIKTFTIQPEARYWLSKPGAGHFFGVHAHVGWFNVKWNRDRYQDTDRPLLGAGISYGYLLPFNEHWAGEFTLGAGYANMRYDTYYNIDNGARIDSRTKNYWGITRIGFSVVYRFNLKK